MQDTFGRTIDYLRLSVTDLCNYRCQYCMPETGTEKKSRSEILSFEEYLTIIEAAAACGITKVRITGGEPLIRKDLPVLCRMIRSVPGIRELAVTTNGSLLPKYARELKDAGVDRLNISLDTLDPEKFQKMTRTGSLQDTLRGIAAAKNAGFHNIKINTVLIGGFNDNEIGDFLALTKDREACVRFIELMPMHTCSAWPEDRFISADTVLHRFPALVFLGTDGVSESYRLPGHKGTVGLIRPMSRSFCGSCRRIRVTAEGNLKPCLHSGQEIPLRGLSGKDLEDAIRQGIECKPAAHHMSLTSPSEAARAMHQIGG